MKVWYIPEGIANIFSMNELEKKYRFTYDSWEGYYVVHTQDGPVKFYKYENRLRTSTLKTQRRTRQCYLSRWCRKKQQACLYRRYDRITRGSPRKRFYKPRRQDKPWDSLETQVKMTSRDW